VDPVDRILAERACERLLYRYAELVDFGNASRLAELFTEDGVWEADDLVLEGRDAIRTHFLRREAKVRRVSRHVCTNVAVDLVSPDEATGLCYFVNYRHDRQEGDLSLPVPAEVPKYMGEYRDRFRRTSDGWLLAHHRVDVAFLRIRPRARPAPGQR
jgi:SnoaL-like domain